MKDLVHRLLHFALGNSGAPDDAFPVVARKSTNIFILHFLAILLGFSSNFLFVKFAGVEGYGAYVYIFNLLYILAPFCTLGTETLLLKNVAAYDVAKRFSEMKGLLVLVIPTTIFATLLVAAATGWPGPGINLFAGRTTLNPFLITLFALLMLAFTNAAQSALQGLNKITWSQLSEKFIRPFILLAIPLIIYLFRNRITTDQLIMTNLGGIASGLAILLFLNWLSLKHKLTGVSARFEVPAWSASAASFFLISVLYVINVKIDIFLLGLFRGNEEIGTYTIALRLSELVSIPLSIINIVLAPLIVRMINKGNKVELQQLLRRISRAVLIAGVAVIVLVLAGGTFFLDFLGITNDAAYGVLAILCAGQLANILIGSVGLLLLMTDNQKYALFSLVSGTVVNIVMNLILVPKLGLVGTALSTASGIVTWNLFMYYFVQRKLNLKTTAFRRF